MSLRSLVALAILTLQLAACAADHRGNKTTIDDMERRHTEDMQRMGGGGSGGGSM